MGGRCGLGTYRVPGVPGTGARILLDFADTAGGATGSLLPTGNPVDMVDVPGVGPTAIRWSISVTHTCLCGRGISGCSAPKRRP